MIMFIDLQPQGMRGVTWEHATQLTEINAFTPIGFESQWQDEKRWLRSLLRTGIGRGIADERGGHLPVTFT